MGAAHKRNHGTLEVDMENGTATIAEEILERLEECADIANGERRTRTLEGSAIVAALRDVINGDAFAFRHAGSVAASYRQPAWTTAVLALRLPDGRIAFEVTAVSANNAPTPGTGRKELQPWRGDGPAGDAPAKLVAWSSRPSVVILTREEEAGLAAWLAANGGYA